MGFSYLTVEELIAKLHNMDKRKYTHSPYISSIRYVDDGCILTMVNGPIGGATKEIKI